jgi:hypothetical protein
MADDEEQAEPEEPSAEEPDIVEQFEGTPEGDLKQSSQEENLNDDDFDYQQGFGSGNYPESPVKDTLLRFNRWVIGLFHPHKVVRVGNLTAKEAKNCKNFLNIANYNRIWNCNLISNYFNDMATVEAEVSMGKKGFTMTNMMTQRRVVTRQSEKLPKAKDWSNPNQGGQK